MRGLFKYLNLFSQRKQKRFWGDEKALVSFISPDLPAVTHLGQVIDINERGISFRYIAQEIRTQGVKELQLFGYRDDELRLDNVPCRIIYDIEVEKKSSCPFRTCDAAASNFWSFLSTSGLSWKNS